MNWVWSLGNVQARYRLISWHVSPDFVNNWWTLYSFNLFIPSNPAVIKTVKGNETVKNSVMYRGNTDKKITNGKEIIDFKMTDKSGFKRFLSVILWSRNLKNSDKNLKERRNTWMWMNELRERLGLGQPSRKLYEIFIRS